MQFNLFLLMNSKRYQIKNVNDGKCSLALKSFSSGFLTFSKYVLGPSYTDSFVQVSFQTNSEFTLL